MESEAELARDLVRRGYLKNPLLIAAFQTIDRANFVIPEYAADAYADEALPIGYGQTISQPLTVAFMLDLLAPEPGETILDIGSGSGWKAALLAYCVSQAQMNADHTQMHAETDQHTSASHLRESAFHPRTSAGHIVTIERIPELKEMAEQNIAKYNFIEQGIVRVILDDGSAGAPQEFVPASGFDRIIAGAAANADIPNAWREQVKAGGRIVAPVGHSIFVYDKRPDGTCATRERYGFSFVPLVFD